MCFAMRDLASGTESMGYGECRSRFAIDDDDDDVVVESIALVSSDGP